VYASFLKQTSGHGQTLDKPTADAIAHAVRVWAMNKGATHYTHWFQPQTDTTAEKHDSFLDFKYTCTPTGNQVRSSFQKVRYIEKLKYLIDDCY